MTPPPTAVAADTAADTPSTLARGAEGAEAIRAGANAPRIVIIGAGPTGLAAGYRLRELGVTNFTMLEARNDVGGLASSERSANGFTYDIGGHVLFSHYPYFDALFDRLMGDEYQELVREAWVWMGDRFLPYPFQNNIRHLPKV
jgi:protoporphyrinogen oxidase